MKFKNFICLSILMVLIACHNPRNLQMSEKEALKVKCLDLFQQNISQLDSKIANFQNVEKIFLNNNQLKTLPKEIGKLTFLKELNLNGNLLDTLPEEFGNLQNLESLSLINNKFTKFPLVLFKLKNLKTVYIAANNLTWEEKEKVIRKNSTQITVYFDYEIKTTDAGYLYNQAVEAYNSKNLFMADYYASMSTSLITAYKIDFSEPFLFYGVVKYNLGDKENACANWEIAKIMNNKQVDEYLQKYCSK